MKEHLGIASLNQIILCQVTMVDGTLKCCQVYLAEKESLNKSGPLRHRYKSRPLYLAEKESTNVSYKHTTTIQLKIII